MTVALEIPTTGTAHRAEGRADAWTILGASVAGADTAEQALKQADLFGWNVRKMGRVSAIDVTDQGVTRIDMPGTFATVRTNPRSGATEYLGTVGSKYTPIQLEAHAEAMDLFARESGATFDRAGAYKNGARAFLTMRLPKTLAVGGFDKHNMYLASTFSHDGSSAAAIHLAPMRWTCGNMQMMFIRGAQHSFSIPHTSTAGVRLAEVHKALFTLFDYQEAFAREAEQMLNTPLSLGQFEKVVDELWTPPVAPKPRARQLAQQRVDTLRTLFLDADTQADIRGTVWAGWNAIGEYLDHYAPTRSQRAQAATRAERSMPTGTAMAKKNLANRFLSLAA